jgi:inhibitor of KinA sporulation pathway (predicted exonuclease)
MNYSNVVFFDLEMCCWNDGDNPKTGEIIEIGIAEVNFNKNEIVRRGQYYVLPDNDTVSEFCTSLTGITATKLKKQGRPLKDVLHTITQKYGGKSKTYSAWGRDDIVLFSECDTKGIEKPFKEFINFSAIFNIKNRLGSNRVNLGKALDMHRLTFIGNPHSGYDDAYNLARLGLLYL